VADHYSARLGEAGAAGRGRPDRRKAPGGVATATGPAAAGGGAKLAEMATADAMAAATPPTAAPAAREEAADDAKAERQGRQSRSRQGGKRATATARPIAVRSELQPAGGVLADAGDRRGRQARR
jgi:hypothetical protein